MHKPSSLSSMRGQLWSSWSTSKGQSRPKALPSLSCVLSFQQGKSTAGMSSHSGPVTTPWLIPNTEAQRLKVSLIIVGLKGWSEINPCLRSQMLTTNHKYYISNEMYMIYLKLKSLIHTASSSMFPVQCHSWGRANKHVTKCCASHGLRREAKALSANFPT